MNRKNDGEMYACIFITMLALWMLIEFTHGCAVPPPHSAASHAILEER